MAFAFTPENKLKKYLDKIEGMDYIKNMNDTNNNNQDEPEDDDAYALRVANGNLAICFEGGHELLDGRYELFGEYEN